MHDVIVLLFVGLVAGVLDYAYAVGFGLAASIMLVGALGYDPRVVAFATSVAQVVSSPFAFISHSRTGNVEVDKNNLKALLFLSALATASSSVVVVLFSRASSGSAQLVYILLLAILAVLSLSSINTRRDSMAHYGWVAAVYASIAGVYKAVIGGGYSFFMVKAQKALGVNTRAAVAFNSLTKLPSFILIGILYASLGYTDVVLALCLVLGAILSTPIAALLLKRTSTHTTTVVLAVSALVTVLWKLVQFFIK